MKYFKRTLSLLLVAVIIMCLLPLSLTAAQFSEVSKVESFHGDEYKDKQGNTYVVQKDTPYFIYANKQIIGTGVTEKGHPKFKLLIRDFYKHDVVRQVLCIEAGVPFGSYVSGYVAQSADNLLLYNMCNAKSRTSRQSAG